MLAYCRCAIGPPERNTERETRTINERYPVKTFLLFCILGIVVTIGCATNTEAKKTTSVSREHFGVQQITLPKQVRQWPLLKIRAAKNGERLKSDNLATAMEVAPFLEFMHSRKSTPLWVREGVIFKEGHKWSLLDYPPNRRYRKGCVGQQIRWYIAEK